MIDFWQTVAGNKLVHGFEQFFRDFKKATDQLTRIANTLEKAFEQPQPEVVAGHPDNHQDPRLTREFIPDEDGF